MDGGAVGDEDKGKKSEQAKAESIQQDEGWIFAGEIVGGDEEEIVGVEDAQHQNINEEVALGRRIGQIGSEG
jgi:hypothetical protein